MQIKIVKLPKSEVELEGELEAEIFESYWGKALKHIGENMEFDGFRKGKAPESVLLSKVGEMRVLEEMAELALGEHYPKIIAELNESNKLDVVGRPEISITKLARKNPLGFKIKTAVLPEIKLPDYKKIARGVLNDPTLHPPLGKGGHQDVSDQDLENTIMDIRKSRAPKVHMGETTPPNLPLSGEENNVPPDKGEDKGVQPELPEFNDEFVKGLGPFKDVEDFKVKLRENIKLEKENAQKEKTRLKIIEKVIDDTAIDTPEILVETELSKILYRMESDITAMGLKFEDYLKHLNKTVEDLKKEFRGDAEKKAKLGLVLNEISKAEKITANEADVAKEVTQILTHYKDADPERARIHAENVLTNERIFQFLESQ